MSMGVPFQPDLLYDPVRELAVVGSQAGKLGCPGQEAMPIEVLAELDEIPPASVQGALGLLATIGA